MEAQFSRFEFKYPMSAAAARGALSALLRYGMVRDPYAIKTPDGSYTVTSLYFDTPGAEDYYDKVGGFLARKKIRVRIYDGMLCARTAPIALEEKAKYDMAVRKNRVSLTHDEYDLLRTGIYAPIAEPRKGDAEFLRILSLIIRGRMRPRIAVRYRRLPLILPNNTNMRITLDSELEACQTNDLRYTQAMRPVQRGRTVMEVKYRGMLPAWFREVLSELGLRRDAFSKYALSLESNNVLIPLPR